MTAIQMLITILLVEVIISLILFKTDLIAPGVVFSVVFLVAAIYLRAYQDYWKVNVNETTLRVICGGVGMFILGCFIVEAFRISGNVLGINKKQKTSEIRTITIDVNVLRLFMIFYVFTEVWMLYSVRQIAIANGGTGSIFSLIGYYNNLAKMSTQYSMSIILNQFISVCIYMGFVWAYIIVNNYIAEKKIAKREAILFFLSCMCGMISGSRGDAIMLFMVAAVMYIMLIRKKNINKLVKIPFRSIIIAAIIIYIVINSFQWIGTLLGRDAYFYEAGEYIAIYLGGPTLNLNNCIQKGMQAPFIWGQETFIGVNNLFGRINGNPLVPYASTRVYYQANYHNTGNVCTVFYDFYHDFGIKGCLILALLMGLFAQWIYNVAKKRMMFNSGMSFSVMMYSLIIFLVARSFFANTLISYVCSFQFIKDIMIWAVAVLLLEKIKIKV